MVYYRSDLLAKDGLKPPATWDDYMTIAKKYQGQDLNGDGAARLRLVHRQEEGRPELLVDHLGRGRAAPEQGTNQGAFFDTKDMTPLFGSNEAMTKALDLYKATKDVRAAG